MKNFRQLGFTLIELLIVISLMAVLAGFTYTNLQTQGKKARDGKRKTDLENIRAALEMSRRDNNMYPANLSSLAPNYIPNVPKDPEDSSSYYYNHTNFTYDLCAHLEGNAPGNCGAVSCGSNTCNYKVIQP